jgi:hypothetical protein
MKNILLLLLSYVMISDRVSGQFDGGEITTHSLSAGSSSMQYKDLLVNDSRYTGHGTAIEYLFSKQSVNKTKELSVEWVSASLGLGNEKMNFSNISLRYAALFRVFKNQSNNRFNAAIGYSFTVAPAFIKISGKESSYYLWNTSNDLGFYQRYHYQLRKSSFGLDINIPVAGFASRPAENNAAQGERTFNGTAFKSYSDLFFTSLHNNKAFSLALEYRYLLSKNVAIQTTAKYAVKNLTVINGSYERSSGISAGLVFKIK